MRRLFFLIVCAVVLPALSWAGEPIDFSNHSFSKEPVVNLDGLWEFYFEEYILDRGAAVSPPLPAVVPAGWNTYKLGEEKLPTFGFGTFIVDVMLPVDRPSRMSIKVRRIKMAHRFYVNGELVGYKGKLGTDKKSESLGHKPEINFFELPDGINKITIVIQVSNFNYTRGGLSQSLLLGEFRAINELRSTSLVTQMFVAGALVVIGFYYLVFWYGRRSELSSLFFSAFCFCIGFRLFVTDEKFLLSIFPDLPTDLMLKMEFASVFWAIPFLHLFVWSIFPQDFSKIYRKLSVVALSAIVLISISVPLIYQAVLLPYHYVYVLLVLVHITVVGVAAVVNRRDGAIPFLTGAVIFFAVAVNDILHERAVINTGYFIRWGTVFFVFAQSSVLSMRFSKAFTELEVLQKSLEEKVAVRTRELEDANKKAIALSDENRRLSRRAMKSLEEMRSEISKQVHDGFNSTLVIVKTHLSTILRLSNESSVQVIAENLKEVVSEAYEKARVFVKDLRPEVLLTHGVQVALDKLVKHIDLPSSTNYVLACSGALNEINPEKSLVIYRVVQEAIANIEKYASANGVKISLSVAANIVLTIEDDGVGFDSGQKTFGLGLVSIRESVFEMNGQFELATSPGAGTTLEISLPVG